MLRCTGIRFFPTQVSNVFFKDSIKIMFPITPEAGFRHVLRCVHGFLWSGSSREFYDRVSSGLRPNAPFFGCWLGNVTFDGLFVCLKKTAAGPKGFFSLFAVFGVSLGRIIPYRGFQLSAFDTIVGLNPWKYDTGMFTSPPRLRRYRQPSFGRRCTQSCRENILDSTRCLLFFFPSFSTLRAWPSARRSPSCSSRQDLPTLRSRSPCASWAPPLSGVCARSATGSPRTAPFCP